MTSYWSNRMTGAVCLFLAGFGYRGGEIIPAMIVFSIGILVILEDETERGGRAR